MRSVLKLARVFPGGISTGGVLFSSCAGLSLCNLLVARGAQTSESTGGMV